MKMLTIIPAVVLLATSVCAGLWFKANFSAAIENDGSFGGVVITMATLGMIGLIGLLTFLVREACIEADVMDQSKSASKSPAHQKQA